MTSILIFDNREYDRILYKEFLGDKKYNFIECDNAICFNHFISTADPELVLLKWDPRRSSEQKNILEQMKVLSSRFIPVIIIAEDNQLTHVESLCEFELNDILFKPITKLEIKFKVQKALNLKKYFQKTA